ncbi:hypothetical protein ACFXD5_07430 [Streptomyces sp. NPDC059385]|uniref:hypothetical protein n=1 Tax=Streptomyces sp. NPDC059385 TaxID=3346817 RepID=UPI00368BC2C4
MRCRCHRDTWRWTARPAELRVGDQVPAGGRLVAIADLRYRHGATCTMIPRNGAAERTIRVYPPSPVG